MRIKVNNWKNYNKNNSLSNKLIYQGELSNLDIKLEAELLCVDSKFPFRTLALNGGSNATFFTEALSGSDAKSKINDLYDPFPDLDLIIGIKEANFLINKNSIAARNSQKLNEIFEEIFQKKYFSIDSSLLSEELIYYINIFDSHYEQNYFHELANVIHEKLTGLSKFPEYYNCFLSPVNQDLVLQNLDLNYVRVFENGLVSEEYRKSGTLTHLFQNHYSEDALIDESIFIIGTSSAYSGVVPFLTYYFKNVSFFWGKYYEDLYTNDNAADKWKKSNYKIHIIRDRFI